MFRCVTALALAFGFASSALAADPASRLAEAFAGIRFAQNDPLARPNSVYVFGGALSTGSMGSTVIFNADRPGIKYDNDIIGAAYHRDIHRLGYGFTLGAEIGIADRFGSYVVCCDTVVMSPSPRQSGELWGGAQISHAGLVFFETLRVGGAATVGLSFTTDSIGREREREIVYQGSGRMLFYLAPELTFSTLARPDIELVYRIHHRSGAGGTLGNLREGYNANVLGLRYRF